MGFTKEFALGTLRLTNGDVERALEMLLEGKGVEEQTSQTTNENPPINQPIDNPPEVDPMKLEQEEELKKKEEQERLDEEELVQDMPNDEESHLDVIMIEEEEALQEYKTLLQSTV